MRTITALILPVFFAFNLYAQNWDINTLHTINKVDNKFVRNCSKIISTTTPFLSIGIPLATAVYAGFDKNEQLLRDAVYIGTSVGEAIVITYGAKHLIGRERPYEKYPGRVDPQLYPSSPSFPSAHTAMAFSLATSLSIKYPKWYVIAPCATWACSVGFARLNEGVHYPSDVIAGAVIGTGCAVINIYVNQWLNKLIFPEKGKRNKLSF